MMKLQLALFVMAIMSVCLDVEPIICGTSTTRRSSSNGTPLDPILGNGGLGSGADDLGDATRKRLEQILEMWPLLNYIGPVREIVELVLDLLNQLDQCQDQLRGDPDSNNGGMQLSKTFTTTHSPDHKKRP